MKEVSLAVDTFVEFSFEEVNSHYGKYKPEDKNDKHDITDRRYGLYQCIHDNLCVKWNVLNSEVYQRDH